MPLAFEVPREGAQSRELPHDRAVADAGRAPLAEKKTQISRLQRQEIRGHDEILAEIGEHLPHIARIGLDGVVRGLLLVREGLKPGLQGGVKRVHAPILAVPG